MMAKLPAKVTRVIVGVVVVAIVAVGAYFVFFNGPGQKTVTARFASAIGIYPGTPVRILGVNVGTVSGVHPTATDVNVTIDYDSKYKLPKNVSAVEVANSLVSDRYIQLTPVYKGGAVLASGATIDTNHTGGPAELDDIYAALDKLAVALGPNGANKGGKKSGALSTLLNVAAANLKGNGAALGNSIAKLASAAETLASQRGNLFQTVKNLQQFTQTLQASDSQIRTFNTQLAQVASDLASERTDLGGALKDLGLALDDVHNFVKANAGKFHIDIQGLENITGVLVKEKSSLNETLAVAPVALANLVHAYQPDLGVLGTRSNLVSAELDTKGLVCAVLSSATNGLGGILKILGKLSKPLQKQVSKICASAIPSTGSSTTPALPGVSLPGLVGAHS